MLAVCFLAETLSSLMQLLSQLKCKEIVLVGDFNWDWLLQVSDPFKAQCLALNLTQIIESPTCLNPKCLSKSSLIDLLITNMPHKYSATQFLLMIWVITVWSVQLGTLKPLALSLVLFIKEVLSQWHQFIHPPGNPWILSPHEAGHCRAAGATKDPTNVSQLLWSLQDSKSAGLVLMAKINAEYYYFFNSGMFCSLLL